MAERREGEVGTLKAVASRLEGALLEVDCQICLFADGASSLSSACVVVCGGAVSIGEAVWLGHMQRRAPTCALPRLHLWRSLSDDGRRASGRPLGGASSAAVQPLLLRRRPCMALLV